VAFTAAAREVPAVATAGFGEARRAFLPRQCIVIAEAAQYAGVSRFEAPLRRRRAMNEHHDDPEFISDEAAYGEPPGKKGWSTGAKVALVLGIVFAVLLIACCGVIIWFGSSIGKSFTQDQAQIETIQEGMISSIDLPEEYAPRMGMDFKIPFTDQGMQMVIFGPSATPDPAGGMLLVMQMQIHADQAELQQALQQSGQQQDITVETAETKTLSVDGEDVDFRFVKGKSQQGADVRQVSGALQGAHGTLFIQWTMPEDQWNEEQVIQTLESIKK
jgi:hypothetical protein